MALFCTSSFCDAPANAGGFGRDVQGDLVVVVRAGAVPD
jgi:hypothetical protein